MMNKKTPPNKSPFSELSDAILGDSQERLKALRERQRKEREAREKQP
jgi:hypothetical protein